MEDYAYASTIGDREAMADALGAIKKHNSAVKGNKKLAGLGISGKDMRSSLRSRRRSVVLREKGIPQSKRLRGAVSEVRGLFPVEGE